MSAETINSDVKDGGITRENRSPGVDEEQAASYESAGEFLDFPQAPKIEQAWVNEQRGRG